MKSDRKQIQESNLLADKIEAQFIKLKKVLPAVLAAIAVVVVALLGYGIYSSIQEKEAAKGWTALYFSDTDTSDLNAIAKVAVAVGHLMRTNPDIMEIDVNPLMVYGEGASALDALIVMKE
jgi:cytochrome c-type biogenesis protein CcmH/NrfG